MVPNGARQVDVRDFSAGSQHWTCCTQRLERFCLLPWCYTALKTECACGDLPIQQNLGITLYILLEGSLGGLVEQSMRMAHRFDQLQITHPNVIPHGVRSEGLLRVLSWVSFDLPEHFKRTLEIT